MPIRKILLPTPNTVAASATSLIQCPVGPAYRYRAIHLKIGCNVGTNAVAATHLPAGSTTTAGYINDIRLKCNGRTQRLHTASQLNRLNSLSGSAFAATTWGSNAASNTFGQVLTLWFAEPWRKSLGQMDALALPSAQLSTLEVEVDFGTTHANVTGYTLTAYAEVDSEKANEVHKQGVVMSKVFRQNLSGGTSANSAVDLTTLDRRDLYTTIVADLGNTHNGGSTGAAQGIVANSTGEFASKLVVTANAQTIHELPRSVAKLVHLGNGLNPLQFDLEAVLDSADDITSGLTANGLSDLRVRVDLGADTANSASWILLTERTGPLD